MKSFNSELKKEDPVEDILEKATEEVAKVEETTEFTVIAASLNIRSSKESKDSSNIVGQISSGEKFTGVEDGDWVKMDRGYVMSRYVAPVKKG